MTPLELLAPARNADIGIAAIRCGADAVYIGGPAFGARVAAGNSVEEIRRLCDFAAQYGAKIFVTVNTLCRDEQERQQMLHMMLDLKDVGVSAFIMQDTSLLPLLHANGPWKEEFHASTQCAIRTPQRALELAGMGFHRLILERQLSLEQIRAIKQAVPGTDLEFFVHGALCVCYSGDCYLSEMLTGRSANRGECAQPCRNMYDLVNGKGKVLCSNKALLSLKDYCLIDRLEDLADAGIISFKIEGRLKNEAYVKNVVRAYSQELDRVALNSGGRYCRSSWGSVQGGFTPDLYKTFNRGYTSLFIDGRRGDWHSAQAAKHIGEYLGKVASVTRDGFILPGVQVNNGDGLCTVSASGEVIGFRADKVQAQRIWCKLPQGLRAGSAIWRNRDCAFEHQLDSNMPQRLLRADLNLEFRDGMVSVTATREDGLKIEKAYDTTAFDLAQKQDRMKEMICGQLGKSSDNYSFGLASLQNDAPLPMLPAAFLNGIRRDIATELAQHTVCARTTGSKAMQAVLDTAVLQHPRLEGELMRTKYCIRYRMGLCPKQKSGKQCSDAQSGLVLKNNGRTIRLQFDCRNCEMILLQ